MAINLKKYAERCKDTAIAHGWVTHNSSATPFLYEISRNWRESLDATNFKSLNDRHWSEKEEAVCAIIMSSLTYLHCIGCKDIERLLKDTLDRYARQK